MSTSPEAPPERLVDDAMWASILPPRERVRRRLVRKHTPGGHYHNQKLHGHRGKATPRIDLGKREFTGSPFTRNHSLPEATEEDQKRFLDDVYNGVRSDPDAFEEIRADSEELLEKARLHAEMITNDTGRVDELLARHGITNLSDPTFDNAAVWIDGRSMPYLHAGTREILSLYNEGGIEAVDRLVVHNVQWNAINEWRGTSSGGGSVAYQLAAANVFAGVSVPGYMRGPDKYTHTQQAFVRAHYNATQNYLKAHGVKDVVLHRGKPERNLAVDNPHERGRSVWFESSKPLSSWTTSTDIARDFAPSRVSGEEGVVMTARVPAKRIFSAPVSGFGFGSPQEWEWVVVGARGTSVVRGADDEFFEKSAVVKHHPGGHNHNQMLHGRRSSSGIGGYMVPGRFEDESSEFMWRVQQLAKEDAEKLPHYLASETYWGKGTDAQKAGWDDTGKRMLEDPKFKALAEKKARQMVEDAGKPAAPEGGLPFDRFPDAGKPQHWVSVHAGDGIANDPFHMTAEHIMSAYVEHGMPGVQRLFAMGLARQYGLGFSASSTSTTSLLLQETAMGLHGGHASFRQAYGQWISHVKVDTATVGLYLRSVHASTQHYLTRAGAPAEITVFRGKKGSSSSPPPRYEPGAHGKGALWNFSSNPLSSWSTSINEAAEFGGIGSGNGFVMAGRAPKSRVLGLGVLGFGSRREREVVLAGAGGVALAKPTLAARASAPLDKALVLKHSPGGSSHNQKTHGRRGSAAHGPSATPSSSLSGDFRSALREVEKTLPPGWRAHYVDPEETVAKQMQSLRAAGVSENALPSFERTVRRVAVDNAVGFSTDINGVPHHVRMSRETLVKDPKGVSDSVRIVNDLAQSNPASMHGKPGKPPGVIVSITTDGMPKDTAGLTMIGHGSVLLNTNHVLGPTGSTRINDTIFGTQIPAAVGLTNPTLREYTITHEWGHAVAKGNMVLTMTGISRYGDSHPDESYAEAFAAFRLGRGNTSRVGVIAKQQGWR